MQLWGPGGAAQLGGGGRGGGSLEAGGAARGEPGWAEVLASRPGRIAVVIFLFQQFAGINAIVRKGERLAGCGGRRGSGLGGQDPVTRRWGLGLGSSAPLPALAGQPAPPAGPLARHEGLLLLRGV